VPELRELDVDLARAVPGAGLVGGHPGRRDGRVRYWVVGELDWAADDVVARVRRLLP